MVSHDGQSRQASKVGLDTKDNHDLNLDWSWLSRPPGLIILLLFFLSFLSFYSLLDDNLQFVWNVLELIRKRKKWYFLVKKIFLTFVTSNCRKAVPWHFHLNGKKILKAKLKFNKVKKNWGVFLYKEQLTQILFPPLPKCKTNNEKK